MIVRFCLYSVFKNLRFADPFLILFLRHLEYDFVEIGAVLGFQHLLTGLLELPFGVLADQWGRRRSLAACFLFYTASFLIFGTLTSGQWPLLGAAVALYGVAEALRTGSHKAIILDYLDGLGRGDRATHVIGLARSFSRAASASAALVGGVILYYHRAYDWLFWLSAAPAFAGFVLMSSYPRDLDGEHQRDRKQNASAALAPWRNAGRLFESPGMSSLMIESVLFESQVKIILKYYMQPFLAQGLLVLGSPVLGSGAIYIGVTEFIRDQLGAMSALASGRVETLLGSRARALHLAYAAIVVAVIGIGLSSYAQALVPGIVLLIGVTMLQNARRPIFVSRFNEVMDKPQRATSLSLESLARTVTVATLLPVTGWSADHFGLWSVFLVIVGVLLGGRLMVAGARPRKAIR